MARKKKAAEPARKRPAARKPATARLSRKAPAKKLKDGRPTSPWWPALSPYLTVRDGQASIEFYARAFGFEPYGEVMRDSDGRVQRGGAQVVQAPTDQFWGDRTAVYKDRDGYHWTFATNVGGFDPSKLPQP